MAENQIRLGRRRLILGMTFVLVAGLLIGFFGHSLTVPPRISEDFKTQSLDDMRRQILDELDYAIEQAEAVPGLYECCVEPPCRICFVEEGECDCSVKLLTNEECEECEAKLTGG